MTTSLDQLRALRRQSGAAPLVMPIDPLEAQVARLRDMLRGRRRVERAVTLAGDRSIPGNEISPGLWLQEDCLPLETPWPDMLDGTFDRRDPIAASDMLFFDTETTGLAGGTGTRAFMIGAADLGPHGLRVRQLTIANVAGEAAMLEAFRGWLRPSTVLVSYNGKSYDAPLLKTRYRLMRQSDPITGLAHLDLLYATRRRYKGVYENCRLATIERRVLGILREDDLPGSEAPSAWLGYLRGGSSRLLRRVVDHNRQDIITLAQLALHLGSV